LDRHGFALLLADPPLHARTTTGDNEFSISGKILRGRLNPN
jgi:hypothetical protein